MADIKASSEIIKMAKEARFGKNPDTLIVNANGQYNMEELLELPLEKLEQMHKEAMRQASVEVRVIEDKPDTQADTQESSTT